jgi:hypothetical protein
MIPASGRAQRAGTKTAGTGDGYRWVVLANTTARMPAPGLPGTAATSAMPGAAQDQTGRRPGSGGSSPPPTGTRNRNRVPAQSVAGPRGP